MQRRSLPSDPQRAVQELLDASREQPVLLFKKSPTCPVSHRAERELADWLKALAPERHLTVAELDVLEQRPLARGITAELDIVHESPQALLFHRGALQWHASHGGLTGAAFEMQLRRCENGG